ncbi:nuclear transport factor 2 family protein [Chitinophaga sp. HK235]|uniref:nuclear transport factor 2 family protein n=1 Tax=Chitinophaga sp. HK235 TaxID=2952571 RepID=UPI001BA918CE|nr:nuclear transport factor 2 family protein [Chitinophaga sp. HK235]
MKKLLFILLSMTVMTTQAQELKSLGTSPLELTYYNAPESSMRVTSVLVSGKKDAVLVDAQFTLPDAEKVAQAIKASGKQLKAIFISYGDPDFYFGLEVFKKYYPQVTVYATGPVIDHIQQTAQGKLDVWGPQLKEAAPHNVVLPQLLKDSVLKLEGQSLEVMNAGKERSFIWIPAIKAVIGGGSVFGDNLHLWMADDATPAKRGEWLAALDRIQALSPKWVIPAHFASGAHLDLRSVEHTRDYIRKYAELLHKHTTSTALINALKAKYPTLLGGVSLELGAKVNTGEMQWGAPPDETAQNLAVVKGTYEGGSTAKNAENLANALTNKTEWTEAAGFPYGGTYIGKDNILKQVFARITADWDDYKITIDHYIATGDEVVAFGTYSGTNRKTGKSFKARVAHHYELKNRKIIRFEQFVDSQQVMDVMK